MSLLLRFNYLKCRDLFIFSLVIILSYSCSKKDNISCDYEIIPNSIVIIPDIQNYTKSSNSLELNSIVDFINFNKSYISMSLQTGDLTNNNTPDQWRNVLDCYINRLDSDITHFECLGNHDYGYNGSTDVRSSNIPWDISNNSNISYGDYNENYVQFVEIGEEEYGILVLEFAARVETLEWAQQIFKSYPDSKFILLTHAFLNSEGQMYSESTIATDYDNPQSYGMAINKNTRNSLQIFNTLMETTSNLKYIICGHSLPKDGFKINIQTNVNGDPVKLIMVNFQHFTNGGDGNIAILNLESLPESMTIYSTRTKECIKCIDL